MITFNLQRSSCSDLAPPKFILAGVAFMPAINGDAKRVGK